jgi:hypothetical protein
MIMRARNHWPRFGTFLQLGRGLWKSKGATRHCSEWAPRVFADRPAGWYLAVIAAGHAQQPSCLAGATVVAMLAGGQPISGGESTMKIRTDRLHGRLMMIVAALFGIALMSVPAAAQGTPEQRAACQGDAQRLCGQYVPDVDRITACMSQKRRYLSPGCRAVFSGGSKKKRSGT